MMARSAVSLTGMLRSLTQLMVGGISLLRYGSRSYIGMSQLSMNAFRHTIFW